LQLQIEDCRLKIAIGMLVWCLIAAPSGASAQPGETIDRVLAIVAGVVITLTDVHAARDFQLVPYDRSGDPTREILTQLIERSLILTEVERYAPPEPEEAAVASSLDAARARFASPEAFRLALARVGLEERHLRELVRQDLRIRSYLDQRFTVVPVSDDQVAAYYREHPALFTRDGVPLPLEAVREQAARAAAEARRRSTVEQWVAGLRRRAEVIDVYATVR
jgi:hypothetical protein